MGTLLVRRPPRAAEPAVPCGEVVVQPPPVRDSEVSDGGVLAALLPMIGTIGGMAFMFVGPPNALMYAMGGTMTASMIGMTLLTLMRQRAADRGRSLEARGDYLDHLARLRSRVRATSKAQYAAETWTHPAPGDLWAVVVAEQRVWERRRTDDDFGQVRFGVGDRRLATPIVVPADPPVGVPDATCVAAMARFAESYGRVCDLPLTVALRSFPFLSVSGDGSAGCVRALICQLAAFHSPDDLRLYLLAGTGRQAEWEWLKWLPHLRSPQTLAEDLRARPRFVRDTQPYYKAPHLVVIVDSVDSEADSVVPHGDGLQGVTVLRFDAGETGLSLVIDDGRVAASSSGWSHGGSADFLSLTQAAAFARTLAPLRLDGDRGGEEPLIAPCDLVELLGIEDITTADVAALWRRTSRQERLRVPLAVSAEGRPVVLDLNEAALGGMGPHGLCVGATGSGKSELLRTLVLALALTHSPDAVNFVLCDFKGGAAFAGLAALPHVAGTITNLADDLALVDRMRDSITGELQRRQQLLHDAGGFKDIHDYGDAHDAGAPIPALPHLVVVIDEFSELLTAKPEMIAHLVQVGRIGRSLGVHLLLASQRLEEGRLQGLDTHLSYRIGLKTNSSSESRVVLGVADAHQLPSIPGSGYLKHDADSMTRFKAAYVSGPLRRSESPVAETQERLAVAPFTTAVIPAQRTPSRSMASTRETPTLLDAAVARMIGLAAPTRQVWLPPLCEPPTLDQLMSRARGLVVPIGIVDKPLEQRRDTAVVDLSGAGGHAAVIGGPRSGKSTAVRTLICALALANTCRDVQFLCVDCGGASFDSLGALPHVAGAASGFDAASVRRIIGEARGLLDERGREGPSRHSDVFLVIDGWTGFRREFEALEDDVIDIARRGLGCGVHLVLTAQRWNDLRPALKDAIGSRIELRLGDPIESEVDRPTAMNVPLDTPGRGITRERLHLLVALPRIDGMTTTSGLSDATAALARSVADAWNEPPAPRVRALPHLIPYADLPRSAYEQGTAFPLGLDEAKLAPVSIDFAADPHLLILGDTESGKTNLLRLLLRGITDHYAPDEARIIIADYRRGLAGTADGLGDHLLEYAVSPTGVAEIVNPVRESMESRLDDPELKAGRFRGAANLNGPELFFVIDDYELVSSVDNPLTPLIRLLPVARDIGLHVVVARSAGGAGRALFEPLLQKLKELRSPGILLSGDPEEGALLGGVRPASMPAGRGILVPRRSRPITFQSAWID